MRIVSNEAASFVYDGDKLIATGSRELCEAVIDGSVDKYIERCRAERENRPEPAKQKRQTTPKPAKKSTKDSKGTGDLFGG